MLSFAEFQKEAGIDYFILQMSEELIPDGMLINEGKWVESGKKDWMLRVDAENPLMNQQRHVHIARSKHINTKNMQVSWNIDGSMHDKGSFNSNIASINTVQNIAKDALNLPDDFTLEEAVASTNVLVGLDESVDANGRLWIFVLKEA